MEQEGTDRGKEKSESNEIADKKRMEERLLDKSIDNGVMELVIMKDRLKTNETEI